MKTFQSGEAATIRGHYLLLGEPPDQTSLLQGTSDVTFIQHPDHSRKNGRSRHFEIGDVFPDLGYTKQRWVLFQEE